MAEALSRQAEWFPLPKPRCKPEILIIAGEHSGDQHAARFLEHLYPRSQPPPVCAMGGSALQEKGAELIFPLVNHAVVGLAEVVRHLGFFKQLFTATLDWIDRYQPRLVVLVDYPGFNLRLARALAKKGLSRAGGGTLKVIQYISPQIWAWKGRRRFEMARYLDGLGVIFPFETECFRDTTLPVRFVGHPLSTDTISLPVEYASDGPLLLLPGSRSAPVDRILPRMLETFGALPDKPPGVEALILAADDRLKERIQGHVNAVPSLAPRITVQSVHQNAKGRAILTSSGTMSLICALAGIPGCLVYRAHPLTFWLGRRLVKLPYIGMPNLLLDRVVYPEFLQGDFQARKLVPALSQCLSDGTARMEAEANAQALRSALQGEGDPAETTAGWVESFL